MKKNEPELILKVGGAGGSLSVWSVNAKDGARAFVVKVNETILKGVMDDEDANGLSFKSETVPLLSFADALVVLGHYPWYRLSPRFVHQDFIDPVLTAVMNLGGEEGLDRWRDRIERSKLQFEGDNYQ
jgi:hypothetical protein